MHVSFDGVKSDFANDSATRFAFAKRNSNFESSWNYVSSLKPELQACLSNEYIFLMDQSHLEKQKKLS